MTKIWRLFTINGKLRLRYKYQEMGVSLSFDRHTLQKRKVRDVVELCLHVVCRSDLFSSIKNNISSWPNLSLSGTNRLAQHGTRRMDDTLVYYRKVGSRTRSETKYVFKTVDVICISNTSNAESNIMHVPNWKGKTQCSLITFYVLSRPPLKILGKRRPIFIS